jgi:hypothetical protein
MWARQNFTGPPGQAQAGTFGTTGAQHAGCSKRLSSKAAASEGPKAYPLGYVEALSDARRLLAAFFSILIVIKQRKGTRWEIVSKSRTKRG